MLPPHYEQSKQTPLRMVRPALYTWMRAKFEEVGLRPYDFAAVVTEKEDDANGSELTIYFGKEDQNSCCKHPMPFDDMYEQNVSLVAFIKDTVALCRQSVMQEYRETMRDRSSV